MSVLLAALYGFCLLGLVGFALFVFLQNPRAALNRYFALLALALLGWVASLFAFDFPLAASEMLWIGRFNFACIIVAVTLGFVFVREVARQAQPKQSPLKPLPRFLGWLWAETAILTAFSFTPFVDAQELIEQGQHITRYGPLFGLYLIHVLVLLGGTLYLTFRPSPPGEIQNQSEIQNQLLLIGTGIVAMASVALVTNVLLPYVWTDFRFIHIGTLSTILFLAAVGYAVFAHHLFSVHRIIRAAFVYAGLIALTLELYQLAVTFLAHLLPVGDAASRSYAATALALVVNAFTQQPVRRWLNRLVDRMTENKHAENKHAENKHAVEERHTTKKRGMVEHEKALEQRKALEQGETRRETTASGKA